MKYFWLFFSLPCLAMDPNSSSARPTADRLPKPFVIATSTPRSKSLGYMSPYEVAKRTRMTADIYKSKGKLYLQVTLYFKNTMIMQNDYQIDPREVAKL